MLGLSADESYFPTLRGFQKVGHKYFNLGFIATLLLRMAQPDPAHMSKPLTLTVGIAV